MGELVNLNPLTITDADIPASIARDTETAAAIANHVNAADPHPVYLTQVEGDGRYRQSAVTLADADIPAGIARDTETAAAIANHEAKADPHPVYLTQVEGDGRYRQSAVTLADADIPASIARDTETAAAIANHAALTDPHPSLWTRITSAFLALTGGQSIIKNNPAMSAVSYAPGQNHLECRTTDGSNPIIGFHRSGFTATALYHLGYGNDSLRLQNADGYNSALLHDFNHINVAEFHGVRTAVIQVTIAGVLVVGSVLQAAIPASVPVAKVVSITGGITVGGKIVPPGGLTGGAYNYNFAINVAGGYAEIHIKSSDFPNAPLPVKVLIQYLA